MRIIHFEDSHDKRMEIFRVLKRAGIQDFVWVTSVGDGLTEVEAALEGGVPFDLAITDMQYPVRSGGPVDLNAGECLVRTLSEREIDLPVIVCSSGNYRVPGAYGCVWYSDLSDWETELQSLVSKRRREVSVPEGRR